MAPSPPQGEGMSAMWWSARNPPEDPRTSFSGKVVLVTGANAGLGYEAAIKFAALGTSRLILGVRSIQRGQEAKEQICRQTGYDAAKVQLYQLDMSTFDSAKAFSKKIWEKEPRLDIAILNAGMAAPSYQIGPEGYGMSLQVNVLSTALLAVLLFPMLQQSSRKTGQPSHLEFVGSVGHRMVKPNALDDALDSNTSLLDHVNGKKNFEIQGTYCTTKLLLMYVMDRLVSATREHHHDEAIITTCCPNLCRTNIGRDFNFLLKLPNYAFQSIFARTAEEGSRTLVSGTTLGKDAHGQFWSHDVFDKKGELVTIQKGKTLQKKAWKEIADVLRAHAGENEQWLLE